MGPPRGLGLLLAAHLLLVAACCGTLATSSGDATDTWAVIVSSSRYWLNYRHTANALAVYQAVRRREQQTAWANFVVCVAVF